MRLAVLLSAVVLVACQRTDEKRITTNANAGPGSGITVQGQHTPPKIEQLKPPVDLENPPIDAVRTRTGLVYKKLSKVPDAPAPKRNDTVMIVYTGWRQTTGETFYSNRGKGQPMALPLSNTAPGFTEAMQLLRKGEKAMLWLPPEIGYKGAPPAGSTPETLVYEVEVVDIVPAPLVPDDIGKPPANAQKLKSGLPYVVIRPGTGKEKARFFDTVTFNYSAWDVEGRMFDSTEMRKRPATVPPYRQTPVMEEILTSMTGGERIRVWVPAERMQQSGKPIPGMPTGILTYELELSTIEKGNEPPPTPRDVARPPEDAQKTARGVAYRVLKAGKGSTHPGLRDTVRVHYTGWTTDGRMFDSSVIKNVPSEFPLGGVIAGWTEGLPLMVVGDKYRFWIPDELAYKGAAGRPQGMLVFDIELLEIKMAAAVEVDSSQGLQGLTPEKPAAGEPAVGTAPPDVAAPPADAKKSPRGVFYKILKAVPGAPHPKASDVVVVHYSGWTTDGKPFDSSKKRGVPYTTALTAVIPGWTDGLQMVGLGESARLWIPKELAYDGRPGPQGMLVFDIDLLEIKPQ